jgi:hypothetical protein
MSCHQNAGKKNPKLRIANISFENVAGFKYLRRMVANQDFIHEDIEIRLNLGNT